MKASRLVAASLVLHRPDRVWRVSNNVNFCSMGFVHGMMQSIIMQGRGLSDQPVPQSRNRRCRMRVGVPKEVKSDEYRVGMMPVGVEVLVAVAVGPGAGVFVGVGVGAPITGPM